MTLQADEILTAEDVPALVIHGKLDDQFPTDESSIYSYQASIESEKVRYLLCDGGHTDLLYDDDGSANDALMESIHNFLIHCIEGS